MSGQQERSKTYTRYYVQEATPLLGTGIDSAYQYEALLCCIFTSMYTCYTTMHAASAFLLVALFAAKFQHREYLRRH